MYSSVSYNMEYSEFEEFPCQKMHHDIQILSIDVSIDVIQFSWKISKTCIYPYW